MNTNENSLQNEGCFLLHRSVGNAVAFLQKLAQLALYALQGVVNGLDVAAQRLGDLLIAFAVQEGSQHLLFQVGEQFADLVVDNNGDPEDTVSQILQTKEISL